MATENLACPTAELDHITAPPCRPGDDAALIDSLVRAGCRQRRFEAGWVLVRAGEWLGAMFVVVQGEVEVRLGARDGGLLATLERGDILGEMSMVDEQPACAFAIALRPTTVMEVPREAFWSMVEASHTFARRILEGLSRRLRANNANLARTAQRTEVLLDAATRDGLTHLRNRRWLDAQLEVWAAERRRAPAPFTFCLLDVDHFKRFNDDYGHQAGDEVLKALGRAAESTLRSTDSVVRYGGEEFAIVLPGAPLGPAEAAIERVRRAVAALRCTDPEGRELPPITFSAGLVFAERFEPAALVATADALLYDAKRQGRNRTCSSDTLKHPT